MQYLDEAVALLRQLIATPRVSRNERQASDLLFQQMTAWQLCPQREGNNVWAVCQDYDQQKPTVLLNAHIDTVKPVATWTRNPYEPVIEGDRLYGLGANGLDPEAVMKIFEAKGRPQDNPLILHVAGPEQVENF